MAKKKSEQEMCFQTAAPAYERINNSEGKRYDTDPYAIMIYQPHVHPDDFSKIPAEGRWRSAFIKRVRFLKLHS